MRWQGGRRSTNVEDRRGMGGKAVVGGGIGTVLLVVVAMLLGVDPREIDPGALSGGPAAGATEERALTAEEQEQGAFVETVLGYTEDSWADIFTSQIGRAYQAPTLVMFTQAVQSACGSASAAMGPFYCPGDQKVYIDLSFYDEMQRRFKAPGDFAQAYVIAHEVGHHVQNLLGISDEVHAARGRVSQAEYNALSVRLELQADCFAGVWANHTDEAKNILERGDIEEALNAAAAIGDDRLQKQSQGYVVPESFTHGTSEQRARWFRKGIESGQVESCDTFNAARL